MTYGITIKSQGGHVEVQGHYGDIPDGTHEISGHEAPQATTVSGGATIRDRNIQITRKDAEGRRVIAAQHYEPEVRS